MTQPTVAGDVFETRNVLGNLPAELTLDDVVLVEQGRHAGQFVLVQITGVAQRVDARLMAQFAGNPRPDAVEILQRIDRLLFRGDVDAEQTGHVRNPEQ